MRPLFPLSFVLLIVGAVTTAPAEVVSWPQRLNANVEAPPGVLPERLDPAAAAWSVELPGPGSSIPAAVGDRLFVTCEIDGKDGVVCLDRNGAEQWRASFGEARAGKHRNATGANPSPAVDDERVYVFFKDTTLAALDHQGNELWSFRLEDRFGEGLLWWDRGTSPVLSSAGVVLAMTEGPDNSYVVTIDRQTGETVWRTTRHFDTAEESDQSYATPAVATIGGVETVVTWGADHLTGHDARSGELLWECGGFNPENEGMWRTIASAAVSGDVAVVPYGRGDWLAAIRLGGSGDVTDTARVWEVADAGSDVPTPWIAGDRVYVLRDKGEVLCLDLGTGDRLWSDKLPRSRAKIFSSPVIAGDRLYAVREDGSSVVAQLTSEGLRVLSESDLDDIVVATPVATREGLLVRTRERLYLFSGDARLSGRPTEPLAR